MWESDLVFTLNFVCACWVQFFCGRHVLQCCISAGLTSIISLWHAEVDVEACQPPPGLPSLPHRFDPLLPPNRFWGRFHPPLTSKRCAAHTHVPPPSFILWFFSSPVMSWRANKSWVVSITSPDCALAVHSTYITASMNTASPRSKALWGSHPHVLSGHLAWQKTIWKSVSGLFTHKHKISTYRLIFTQ